MWKADKVKIRLLGLFFGQKADFSGKKRTNLGAFFGNGPLSDQGLLKRTYLAALQWGGGPLVLCYTDRLCFNKSLCSRGKFGVHRNMVVALNVQ